MITLPFPSSKLSGQHNAHHWVTRPIINAHRENAAEKAKEAGIVVPDDGDIRIHVRFIPPDRRGDRVNFPNRMKPYFDGIADALGINDSRFLPSYEFCEPQRPGRVEVFIPANLPVDNGHVPCLCAAKGVKMERPGQGVSAPAGPDQETCSGGSDGS